ncbi:MAG: hypothetical protein U0350_24470 [Caldilineaceae bacterium]
MSHPFGDLISQHLHRKHGLSQTKLAEGILQDSSIITKMCKGQRLNGPQARERVCAIITWLHQQAALTTVEEANGLLRAAGMAVLRLTEPREAQLLQQLGGGSPAPTLHLLPVTPKPRTNLPAALTSFVGRAVAVSEIVQLIADQRLVTLTGAGGVGKTRLALEVGKAILDFRFEILDSVAPQPANLKSKIPNLKFPDGIWFVDLAPLTEPGALPQRILDLWRMPEQPERSALESLLAYLRAKAALLILDNCEHLIAACAELAEVLLQQCPQLSLLATSREALNIGGETPWRVPSLTRPLVTSGWAGQAAALARFEAVALFVERARVRQPGFALTPANAPAVAQICSRLDGIPLALEMAAARVTSFTVEELARRLDGVFDGRFQLLTGARTAPLRHQTLRATLEWSYGLLTPGEQRLLLRLSIFSGGWTAAAAETVTGCSLALLVQLVNKSLVIADQQGGQTRYRLLETVRQFAAEQGAMDGQAHRQVQAQHSRYYLTLVAEQEQRLQSPEQRAALDTLRSDFENIKVAWRWAVEQRDFALLARATHALFLYCEVRGNYHEGVSLFAVVAVELTTAAHPTNRPDLQPLLGRVLARLGACKVLLTSHKSAVNPLEQALRFVTMDWERAFTLAYLGWAAIGRGEWSAGRVLLDQSLVLSRQGQDSGLTALGLFFLANSTSDYKEAVLICEESLVLWRQVGRPDRIADVLGWVAWHICCLGDYAKATAYWLESTPIYTALGMQSALAWALDCQGWTAWCQGDLATAQSYLQEAAELYRTIGMPGGVGMCLAELALVLRSGGAVEQAVAVARQAIAIVCDTENLMTLIVSLYSLGAALINAGDFEGARQALSEAIQRALVAQLPYFVANAFYYFVELLVLESHSANLPLARQALAVTLLSCVRTQAATWQIYKEKAAQLQAEIEESLPIDLRVTAVVRGQNCTLEEMVKVLLEESIQDNTRRNAL